MRIITRLRKNPRATAKGVAIGVVLLGFSIWVAPYVLNRGAHVFDTRAFKSIVHGDLQIRTDGEVLLFRRVQWDVLDKDNGRTPHSQPAGVEPAEVVYRYDPHSRELSQVDGSVWRRADRPGTKDATGYGGNQRFHIRWEDEVATKDGVPIDTKGWTALQAIRSPDGKQVAIISATGWRPGVIFGVFGKDPCCRGRHYCEIFRVYDMKPVGGPVFLRIGSGEECVTGRWTGDGQYVVVTGEGEGINRVAIIKVSDL